VGEGVKGWRKPDGVVEELGARCTRASGVAPGRPRRISQECNGRVLFSKIVMIRNNLRCSKQKINAHEKLADAEKVEMQHILRCWLV